MRIKKKNTSEYLLTEDGIWVRNICKPESVALDLNDFSKPDCSLFLQNEFNNKKKRLQSFEINSTIRNAVIVSDGYDFAEKQKILAQLPFKEVTIFAVNGALSNWKLVGKQSELQRAINWYVVNNPYPEVKKFLPTKHAYYPPCIASCRTHPEFTHQYKSGVMLYSPVPDSHYAGLFSSEIMIDDYRNPICAAIGLAYQMGAKKIVLFCCDDSFAEERPASVRLENGLWSYPQQFISTNIIDGMLFWLKQAGISIVNCSSGRNLNNASYISAEQIMEFFKDD
jgi:hypothetical protein